MNQSQRFGFCYLLVCLLVGFSAAANAQISPGDVGSFTIYVAGTKGSHRGNIHYGTVTIAADGAIRGTVRDFDRNGASERVTGSMTLATGSGQVRVGADTIQLRNFTSRTAVIMTGDYFKGSSRHGGVVGGIR